MTYDTMNPVPSDDPRDLEDNAKAFDRFLQSDAASEPDRRGVLRKTYKQMERDAEGLVSPNVAALAAAVAAANKGFYFSSASPVAISTYDLNPYVRSLGGSADGPAFRAGIGALAATDTAAYSGSAAKLTVARSITLNGDGSWTVSFDGSANVTGDLTLASTGVAAGTYGLVTVDAKGRVTAASTVTPVANGGTGQTTIAAAAAALAVPKLGWTSTTPTVAAGAGTFTSASAAASYCDISGIRHMRVAITITTKGTGTLPTFTLAGAALAGFGGMPCFTAYKTNGTGTGKSGTGRISAGLNTVNIVGADGVDLLVADGDIINLYGSYPLA